MLSWLEVSSAADSKKRSVSRTSVAAVSGLVPSAPLRSQLCGDIRPRPVGETPRHEDGPRNQCIQIHSCCENRHTAPRFSCHLSDEYRGYPIGNKLRPRLLQNHPDFHSAGHRVIHLVLGLVRSKPSGYSNGSIPARNDT